MTEAKDFRRRPDGSIDFDHYVGIARGLRAGEQRARLAWLAPPLARLLRTYFSRQLTRIRSLLGT